MLGFPQQIRRFSSLGACLVVTAALLASCGDDGTFVGQSGTGRTSQDGGSKAGKPDAGSSSTGRADGGSHGSNGPGLQSPAGGDDSGVVLPPMMTIDECGSDNPGGLSDAQIQALKAGGSTDGVRLLYPYDGTVFPRGIGGPMLMWEGTGTTGALLHVMAADFEYTGCLKVDAAGQLKFPDSAWAGAEQQTLGPKTPFTFEVSFLDGGTVRGPIRAQFVIAQATLKGSLYYNTYNSLVGSGTVSLGGVVLRIKPGKQAEFFTRTGECTGCHSISANGKRMVTDEPIGVIPGYVFAIDTDTTPNPDPLRTAANVAFVGLAPDGSTYLTTARQGIIGPETVGAVTAVAPAQSQLFETDSGNVIANSGFPTSAMMPTFSFDGTLAAFNDFTVGNGMALSLMDYDLAGRRASNQRTLYTTSSGFVGWPFLLPDNGALIFTQTESGVFSGGGAFITPAALQGPKSDLWMVDTASGQATILARAMGFATPDDANAGTSYLPFGPEEQHQAYYPTVSPVAAGGYFWIFFDSIRHYGNQGLRRQLWCTAVSVKHRVFLEGADNDAPLYATDLSNPAFYFPGQDFNTANHRAFTALDPCLADGATCESGVDCCSGFCTDGTCGPPAMCSNPGDRCKADTDCCVKTEICIGGYCGDLPL